MAKIPDDLFPFAAGNLSNPVRSNSDSSTSTRSISHGATSVEAFLGSRVHDTLEELYRNKLNAKSLDEGGACSSSLPTSGKSRNPTTFSSSTNSLRLDDYYHQGVKALDDYWNHYYPFDGEKTIALEQRIELYLDDAKQYRLQGFIDRISKTASGVWQIRDYKTKRALPTLQEARLDRQLALYQIGLQHMWDGTENVELIWHYLLFDEEIKSTREKSDLEKLKIETIHLIQQVEKAIDENDFPYRESRLCDWCDYFDICPAKKHLAQVRKLPPREFKEDEGVQLVDSYSHLLVEKSRLNLGAKRSSGSDSTNLKKRFSSSPASLALSGSLVPTGS